MMMDDLSVAGSVDIRSETSPLRSNLLLTMGIVSLGILAASIILHRIDSRVGMFLRQEYIPQREGILKSSAATFVIDASSIEGYYGYLDIPSMLFKYSVSSDRLCSAGKVLSEIEERAKQHGWKVIGRNAYETRFGRSYRDKKLWCIQDVRIRVGIERGVRTVFVCWTNADNSDEFTSIDDSREAAWIFSELWPRFDKWAVSNEGPSRTVQPFKKKELNVQ